MAIRVRDNGISEGEYGDSNQCGTGPVLMHGYYEKSGDSKLVFDFHVICE